MLKKGISMRKRFALTHRITGKEIILQNINRFEILMHILQRVIDGEPFKSSYIQRIPKYEEIQSVLSNRRPLRKYLNTLQKNAKEILGIDDLE